MRLTFVLESFGRGGKERRCLQLIQGLNKKGITAIQVITINDERINYEDLFSTSAHIEFIRRKLDHLSFKQTLSLLRQKIKSFNPDIIISWGVFSGLMMACLKFSVKAKFLSAFVADTIRMRPFSKGWLMRKIVILSNSKVIGNSQAGLDAYLVPGRKGIRIVNGFNFDRMNIGDFDKEKLRSELGVTTEHMVVMLSRFNRKYKDYQIFIDVAKVMVRQRKDISFVGIGKDDEERLFFENQLSSEEKKFIRLYGFRKDIEKILSISDISVLFSNLKNGEGISNTIMESMAFGVPVIATWSGGTPEIIKDGINGFMVKGNYVGYIVNTINRLLDDKYLYESISKKGKETIIDNFTLDRMTDRYIELFETVMNARNI